ncbi:protein SINE1-like [Oryza brachyantha]|nr:protein SINE1-like [Oryza brachyantha]
MISSVDGTGLEMGSLMMDPLSSKAAFNGLRLFVKDLDSNTLPPFLARVCDPVKPCSYSDDEMLCIFETAAQAHGRKIVLHVGLIVSTLIRIISSSVAVSLQNASGCSKAVCTLSRYVVDPLATEEEKTGIFGSICRPLSDCLMSTEESISFGSALCVAALVESTNWRFASNELVNDVCLKVSGALQEVHGQTVAHLNLVVALSKQNPLTLEPYGRSLIRSGLHILDESAKASSPQMIVSSIQMIHSIMKSCIISSEINSIIHAMEQFQDDSVTDVSIAAFQACETARLLDRQESGHGNNLSQLGNYSVRHTRKGPHSHPDMDIRDDSSCDSHSCEVRSVHLSTDYDSRHSMGQCVDVSGSRSARRRLWSNKSDKSHGISNYDFFQTVKPDNHDVSGLMAHSNSVDPLKPGRRFSDVPTRVVDQCYVCSTAHATSHCSQISKVQVLSGDIRMKSTPRKQLHSCTFCRDSERDGRPVPESPAIQHCSGPCLNILQFKKNSEFEERREDVDPFQQEYQYYMQNTDVLIEDLKLPADNDESFDAAAKSPCQECQDVNEKKTGGKKRNESHSRYPVFVFVCVVAIVALLFCWWKEDYTELYVIPT